MPAVTASIGASFTATATGSLDYTDNRTNQTVPFQLGAGNSGIFGGSVVTPLMNSLGVRDPQARGFAAGLAAHGIGTARAFQVNSIAGAFAGIAMSLNGALTAMILPLLAHIWGH